MKKKIISFLCSFCMILTCMVALTACKKDKDPEPDKEPEKVIASAFYLNDTKLTDPSLSYSFGDEILEDLQNVTFVASVDATSQTFDLLETEYSLSYNNFETTQILDTLPQDWSAGTYTFALAVTVAEETINGSLEVLIGKVANPTVYDLTLNAEDLEMTIEYDNSDSLGNDPNFTLYQDTEVENDANAKFYYISAEHFEAYQALATAADKYNYLNTNKTLYNGTYQLVPADYYIFAAVDGGVNYNDAFTNLVKLTITKAQQDYSMVNIQMEYTFNTATCTGDYVTLDQIVAEIGMPTIDEFDGTIEWAEDYSDLQLAYSALNPNVYLQVNLVPSNPYIEYTSTTIDVTLTLKQGLIMAPTLKEEALVFMYTGAPQGITLASGSQYFDNWFSETDARFVSANFDTHTDVGTYTFVAALSSNPNFAFTEDGQTASAIVEMTIGWSIEQANHRCNVLGLSGSPVHVSNTERIETTETLSAEGKIALPTFAQFYHEIYIDQALSYEIIDEDGVSTGVAEIVGANLVVTTPGTIVLKVTNPGNSNVQAIELTIVYHFV